MIKKEIWAWLIVISIISGIMGILSKEKLKNCTNKKCKITSLITGIFASMLVAYFTFVLSLHYLQSEHISIALAGVLAWMGTDALLVLQNFAIEFLERKSK